MSQSPIWVIQGPNLNLLGEREPEIYGKLTLIELQQGLDDTAATLNLTLRHFQSNHEGALIDQLQLIRTNCAGVLLNAGGYTHTSVALRDTISAVKYPVVEVHLTDTSKRESFRKISYLRDVAVATFQGEGVESYRKGLSFLADWINGIRPAPKPTSNIVFRKSEVIRLDDTDAAGILFNAHLFRIVHRAYEDWMTQIGFSLGSILKERTWGIPVVRLEGDFVKPMFTSMPITIEIELIKLGERSLTLGYRLFDENHTYAVAQSVHVATDFKGGKAQFPDKFIQALDLRVE